MKWIWILICSLPGFLLGLLSAYGITGESEIWYWVTLALLIAFIFGYFFNDYWFRYGFLTAFLTGIWNSLTLAFLMPTYFDSNPDTASMWIETAGELDPAGFIFFSGFPIGAAYGLAVGLLTLLLSKFLFRKKLTSPAE